MPPRKKSKPQPYPTSVRLPADLLAFVTARAAVESRSVSYVIVEVLQQWRTYCEKVPKRRRPQEKLSDAKS